MQFPRLRFACLAGLAAPLLFVCSFAAAQAGPGQAQWSTFAGPEERPAAQAQPGSVKLVLLRQPGPQEPGFPADILVDGRFLTSLLPGGFAEVHVCPGPRLLELAGQGTSGLNFRPRHGLEARLGQVSYVLVQSPNAPSPLRSDLSADQAEALLQGLRRQTHAVSRVPPALNCPPPASEPAPVVAQPTAAPASPPPSPPPAAPSPPAPVQPRKFTLSAEMLFAFGGSKPQHLAERGRREVVALAGQLKGELLPTDRVLVQGHTDPAGSDGLNQRLSSERAETVRSILLSQGIPASQVSAQGLGSAQLVVKDCAKQHAQREDRIRCDLPNRRVEITVAPSKN